MFRHYNYYQKDFLNQWFRENDYLVPVSKFKECIQDKKNQFYSLILKDITSRHPILFVPMDKDLSILKEGHPILCKVSLDTFNKVSFLVRSDKLHLFFKTNPLDRETRRVGCSYSKDWHYRLVHLCFRTIPLTKDETTLTNSIDCKILKSRMNELNTLLGEIQGYTPSSGYIIGRQYKSSSGRYRRYNDKICSIDFEGIPSIPTRMTSVEDSLNMKYESEYQSHKERVARKRKDVTLIWNCGISHRDLLEKQGIHGFMDSRCTAEAMGITGIRASTINAIISQQQSDTLITLPPDSLEEVPLEYYVDFETIPACLLDPVTTIDTPTSNVFLFLIGVGWLDKGEWKYKSFVARDLSFLSEYRLLKEFIEFIPTGARLFHWHHAEPTQFTSALKRHRQSDISLDWFDLEEYFRVNRITVKNCFNFKLKPLCKALNNHKLIHLTWEENITNGLDCSVVALESFLRNEKLDDVILYNEYDCKALSELTRLLRN